MLNLAGREGVKPLAIDTFTIFVQEVPSVHAIFLLVKMFSREFWAAEKPRSVHGVTHAGTTETRLRPNDSSLPRSLAAVPFAPVESGSFLFFNF